jgi:hypothetical protein
VALGQGTGRAGQRHPLTGRVIARMHRIWRLGGRMDVFQTGVQRAYPTEMDPISRHPPASPPSRVDGPPPPGGRWVTTRGILPPAARGVRPSAPLTGRTVCGIRPAGAR